MSTHLTHTVLVETGANEIGSTGRDEFGACRHERAWPRAKSWSENQHRAGTHERPWSLSAHRSWTSCYARSRTQRRVQPEHEEGPPFAISQGICRQSSRT